MTGGWTQCLGARGRGGAGGEGRAAIGWGVQHGWLGRGHDDYPGADAGEESDHIQSVPIVTRKMNGDACAFLPAFGIVRAELSTSGFWFLGVGGGEGENERIYSFKGFVCLV